MTTLHTVVLVFHVLIGAMIVGLVLVQRGKGAETGAAFGSGASATVFGAKGSANFLSRSTAVLATLFFGTSLGLAYLGSQRPVANSLLDEPPGTAAVQVAPEPAKDPAGAPAVPPQGSGPAPQGKDGQP